MAAEVEEALLPQATCLDGKALRARAMKTILNDATFIFVYQSYVEMLRCKELVYVIPPCNVILYF